MRPVIGKINVCLKNLDSAKQIILPEWTAVGEIAVANAILALLVPKPRKDDPVRAELSKGKVRVRKNFWKKIDL